MRERLICIRCLIDGHLSKDCKQPNPRLFQLPTKPKEPSCGRSTSS